MRKTYAYCWTNQISESVIKSAMIGSFSDGGKSLKVSHFYFPEVEE